MPSWLFWTFRPPKSTGRNIIFFVNGRHWEYNPFDREDTLGILAVSTTSENLRELPFALVWPGFQRLYGISNIALVAWPSGVRPGLSPETKK